MWWQEIVWLHRKYIIQVWRLTGYMISDSAGSVAAESQKADPLTRLAAAAEQDFDILEEEQESDNSPGWHTETQGSKTYKYYNNSAGNRLKGYRKIKKDYYFFSQKSGYAVCNVWKYVRIKGKKYKLYFDKKGRRSDPTKKIIWLRSTQKMVQRGSSFRSKQWFVRWA